LLKKIYRERNEEKIITGLKSLWKKKSKKKANKDKVFENKKKGKKQ